MNRTLGIILILAVTVVLLSLLFVGNQSSLFVVVALTVILVAMILVVGGAPNLLPSVLRIILSEFRRLLRP